MTALVRAALAFGIVALLSGVAPAPSNPNLRSIGIIAALGDTCMFERIPNTPLEWIAPPMARFLEISDWGIDDEIARAITARLRPHYRVQPIAVEHQDFDSWTYDSLARNIRELAIPERPVDAYLLVLRDWRHDSIGNTNHQLGGLGLYRRDPHGGRSRYAVFAAYRLVLLDPNSGVVIVSRPALATGGRLPWIPASPSLWPHDWSNPDDRQRSRLRADLISLIDATLPAALKQIGFVF